MRIYEAAAVLLRSLDSDTAAIMLGQLSPAEAASLRAAIRDLGTIEDEEQADVAAEFRRTRPAMNSQAGGVELELSIPMRETIPLERNISESVAVGSAKRFEFLANAPANALVPYLSREHSQTIAVVLAHLAPARAAAVLAALPEKLQAETIERLSALGETDPDSLTALERELAAWMATRTEDRGTIARRRETVANILAATDAKTRRGILSKLKTHNGALAAQFGSEYEPAAIAGSTPQAAVARYESKQASDTTARIRRQSVKVAPERPVSNLQPLIPRPAPLPRIEFDHLIHLDKQALTAVLRDVDATVLAIALVGSQTAFIDRICKEMPKRIGRDFRRGLRKVGPTRLSDVEAAQRAVADAAARHLSQRRELATSRS